MSLVTILNEVKKEVKKKILIASFFAVIMVLVPFTAIAREVDVRSMGIEGQKEENLMIELKREELRQIYGNFKDILKDDYPTLYKTVLKTFNNAIIVDRNGAIKIDLTKFEIKITDEIEFQLSQALQQTIKSNTPSISYKTGGGGLYLSRQRQTLKSVFLKSGDDPIENFARILWNKIIQPLLGDSWPEWRQKDNDGFDHDGPSKADEDDESKPDNPKTGEKYSHMGLDDYMDWNCLAAFLFVIWPVAAATIICLLTLIFIVGLIGMVSVILGYGAIACLFLEAFDFKDLPYQYPNSGWDGL